MNSHEWKIHKKLIDVGGLGPVAYIIPARGGCQLSAERLRVLELLERGRTVVYVRPEKQKNLLGGRQPWAIRDRDVLTPERYERAERIWTEFWNEQRKGDTI